MSLFFIDYSKDFNKVFKKEGMISEVKKDAKKLSDYWITSYEMLNEYYLFKLNKY